MLLDADADDDASDTDDPRFVDDSSSTNQLISFIILTCLKL